MDENKEEFSLKKNKKNKKKKEEEEVKLQKELSFIPRAVLDGVNSNSRVMGGAGRKVFKFYDMTESRAP